jgi:hypothetical protein
MVQLFRSADNWMNERQLYTLYSHKDLFVLGIGRMAKGRKILGCFSFPKLSITHFLLSYVYIKILLNFFQIFNFSFSYFLLLSFCAGILEQSLGARNRVRPGLSYSTGPPEPIFVIV